jgi:hypothetical protein
MRADVPVGVDLPLEAENPDRDRPDVDNEAVLFSDFFGSADIENCGCIWHDISVCPGQNIVKLKILRYKHHSMNEKNDKPSSVRLRGERCQDRLIPEQQLRVVCAFPLNEYL